MNSKALSDRYDVRDLKTPDIPAILALCRTNPLYYRYCPPEPEEGSIARDMRALPAGKSMYDKHYLGFFDGERLAAVLDLIERYPGERSAFIGFFMVDAALQGRGVGSEIVRELCAALRGFGYEEIRLGWISANPQAQHFWRKNGFSETGASYETDGYTVTVARRRLAQENGEKKNGDLDRRALRRGKEHVA